MTRFALLMFAALSHSWIATAGVPQFRGADGNGISTDTHAPVRFSITENLDWQTELPGKGWSSPVAADGKLYLTTAIEEFPTEQEREELLTKAGDDPKIFAQRAIAKSIQLNLLVVDLQTGALEQALNLTQVPHPNPIHKVNSYASPTPVLDASHLFCHFGTYGTFCLQRSDLTIKWQRQIPLVHGVGPGSSPFLFEDLLILICDGVDQQFVTALDKHTGEPRWRTDRPEMDAPDGDRKKSFDTPVLAVDSMGRTQLICMGSQWVVAYEPVTGHEIWKVYHGDGFSVVPRPVVGHGMVYISTGFTKAQLWAIRLDGSGDVTDSHVAWKATRNIPTKPSPLLVDDRLYVMSDTGIASCFDATDGTLIWTERVGGNYSASPLFADGKIYFASESGVVSVCAPGDRYQLLAENQLPGQIMASPIALDDALVIRTDRALLRFRSEHQSEQAAGLGSGSK